MKKDRKTFREDNALFADQGSGQAYPKPQTAASRCVGHVVEVDPSTGRVVGMRELSAKDLKVSRQDYAELVRDALRERDADSLPALAHLGGRLGLSIFDVVVPVICSHPPKERAFDIISAAFVLNLETCFEWLLEFATTTEQSMRAKGSLQQFAQFLLPHLNFVEQSTQRRAMAVQFVAWAIAEAERTGQLAWLLHEPFSWIHQPLAKAELLRHVGMKASTQERVEIAGALGIIDFSSESGSAQAGPSRSARAPRTTRAAMRI